MTSNRSRYSVIVLCIILQACGTAHINQGLRSEDISQYANAFVEVEVRSTEQKDDAIEMNRKMEEYATRKLSELIQNTHKLVDPGDRGLETLAFKIGLDIRYGSRAARYWAGFGAGKGSVNSTFEVVDSDTGEVKYRATGESDLAVGAFGGSMQSVISKNIDALVEGYQN